MRRGRRWCHCCSWPCTSAPPCPSCSSTSASTCGSSSPCSGSTANAVWAATATQAGTRQSWRIEMTMTWSRVTQTGQQWSWSRSPCSTRNMFVAGRGLEAVQTMGELHPEYMVSGGEASAYEYMVVYSGNFPFLLLVGNAKYCILLRLEKISRKRI